MENEKSPDEAWKQCVEAAKIAAEGIYTKEKKRDEAKEKLEEERRLLLKERADLRQRLLKGGIQDEKRLEAIKDELTAATKRVNRYKKQRMPDKKMRASKTI